MQLLCYLMAPSPCLYTINKWVDGHVVTGPAKMKMSDDRNAMCSQIDDDE